MMIIMILELVIDKVGRTQKETKDMMISRMVLIDKGDSLEDHILIRKGGTRITKNHI